MSYTFTRFALAPWLAFRIYRIATEARKGEQRTRTTFALVALFFTALLMVSPEIALAFGLGSLGFLLLRGNFRSIEWWTGYTMMLVTMAATIDLAVRAHLFDTLRTFGGGARDFPIFPAGHILLFLPCVFLSFLHLARKVSKGEIDASVYLVLISIPMLASALGSCDPLHVLFSGFGFLVVGLLYLSQSKRSWDPARLAFSVFFILVLFSGLALERLFEYKARLEHLFREGEIPHIAQTEAYPGTHGILEAPFGFSILGIEAYSPSWIDRGRYLGIINAPSMHDIGVKEQELEEHPDRDVLVPVEYYKLRKFDGQTTRIWLEVEFAAPFWMPVRHAVNPYVELCNFLEMHYHKVLPAGSHSYKYEVWARKR